MTNISFTGIDPDELARVLQRGTDHGGDPIEPYRDDAGGRPLRCCLTDSQIGDKMALIAWSPFDWQGAYRETGPIFVHTSGCCGPQANDALPVELDSRPMVLRPYTHDHKIAYRHVRHVSAGDSLTTHLAELLAKDDVDIVHGRNVTGGCYSFEAKLVPRVC